MLCSVYLQELLIQQLQDEIKSLRDQGSDLGGGGDLGGGQGVTTNATIQNLQQKLKNAARKITELAKERQQLIEMGNKLRSELKKAGKFIFNTSMDQSKICLKQALLCLRRSMADTYGSFLHLCCFPCRCWWHHTLGFPSITSEGMHQFHSKFTEGYAIVKYRSSLNYGDHLQSFVRVMALF